MQEIKISEVLSLLEDFKTRDEIGEHFELNKNEVKVLFAHPKLKGQRQRLKPTFSIKDDTVDTVEADSFEVDKETGEVTEAGPKPSFFQNV